MTDFFEPFGTPAYLVMDPVHGGIPLFGHERQILRHPLLQRLRFVAQTDVLFLVFPGARHSRFEHSLGALHVAGRYFKAVVRAYLTDPLSPTRRKLSREDGDALRYLYWTTRLAALLHDAGHGPFSHQLEHARSIASILSDRDTFSTLWPGDSWEKYYDVRPKVLAHEHYSARIAHEVLSGLRSGKRHVVEPVDVLCLLDEAVNRPSPAFRHAANRLFGLFLSSVPEKEAVVAVLGFLREMISGELDVDKMDYLLRDALYSGTHYGSYNLDHLLNTILLGFDKDNHWVGPAIAEKGLGALEDFVHSRFQHYLNVVYHKTVSGFRWLLTEAVEEALQETVTAGNARQALTSLAHFEHFTDTFFWEAFHREAQKHPLSASARLLRREPLRCVGSARDISSLARQTMITDLKAKTGNEVVYWASDAKFSRLGSAYTKLRVLVRDRVTGKRRLEDVPKVTSFFSKFSRTDIIHFFQKPQLR